MGRRLLVVWTAAAAILLGGCVGAGAPDARYAVSLQESGGDGLVYVLRLEDGKPAGEQAAWRADVQVPAEAETRPTSIGDAYHLSVLKNGILLDDGHVFVENEDEVAIVLWDSVMTGTEFRAGDEFRFVVTRDGNPVHSARVLVGA